MLLHLWLCLPVGILLLTSKPALQGGNEVKYGGMLLLLLWPWLVSQARMGLPSGERKRRPSAGSVLDDVGGVVVLGEVIFSKVV